MKLAPYRKIIGMTKDAINKTLVPVRARQARQQGELEVSKIEEKILTLEVEIQEITAAHPLDYYSLLRKLDDIAILERRARQFRKVMSELFGADD